MNIDREIQETESVIEGSKNFRRMTDKEKAEWRRTEREIYEQYPDNRQGRRAAERRLRRLRRG